MLPGQALHGINILIKALSFEFDQSSSSFKLINITFKLNIDITLKTLLQVSRNNALNRRLKSRPPSFYLKLGSLQYTDKSSVGAAIRFL